MKKFIVTMSLVLTAGLFIAYANPDPDPTKKVLDGFKKEFPAAQHVSWTSQAEFDKAIFVMAGRRVIAYFTKEGELEGTVRDIFFDQLPLTVMSAVDKRYDKAIVIEVREINNAEGTTYKMRLELKDRKLSITVSPDGTILNVKKL